MRKPDSSQGQVQIQKWDDDDDDDDVDKKSSIGSCRSHMNCHFIVQSIAVYHLAERHQNLQSGGLSFWRRHEQLNSQEQQQLQELGMKHAVIWKLVCALEYLGLVQGMLSRSLEALPLVYLLRLKAFWGFCTRFATPCPTSVIHSTSADVEAFQRTSHRFWVILRVMT